MNKQELVEAVATKLGDDTPKKQVEATVKAVLDEIKLAMRKGDSVQLMGFGTFEPRRRAARTARNPQTGEKVRVKAATVPAFRPSQKLKDYVGRKPGAKTASAKKATKKAAGKKASRKKAAKKSAKRTAKKTARKR